MSTATVQESGRTSTLILNESGCRASTNPVASPTAPTLDLRPMYGAAGHGISLAPLAPVMPPYHLENMPGDFRSVSNCLRAADTSTAWMSGYPYRTLTYVPIPRSAPPTRVASYSSRGGLGEYFLRGMYSNETMSPQSLSDHREEDVVDFESHEALTGFAHDAHSDPNDPNYCHVALSTVMCRQELTGIRSDPHAHHGQIR